MLVHVLRFILQALRILNRVFCDDASPYIENTKNEEGEEADTCAEPQGAEAGAKDCCD